LAGLLHYGSWLASAAIGLGLAMASLSAGPAGVRIATAGIALFILLPSVRVLTMVIVFARQRDYRFSAIAALVLTIVLLGFVLGIRTMSAGG